MRAPVEAGPTAAQSITARTAARRKGALRETRSARPNGGAPPAGVAARPGASSQPLSAGTAPSTDSAARVVRELDSNDGFVAAALMALTASRPQMAPQAIEKARFAPGIGTPSGRTMVGENPLAPPPAQSVRPEKAPQVTEKPRFAEGNGCPLGPNARRRKALAPAAAPSIRLQMAPQVIEKSRLMEGNDAPFGRGAGPSAHPLPEVIEGGDFRRPLNRFSSLSQSVRELCPLA